MRRIQVSLREEGLVLSGKLRHFLEFSPHLVNQDLTLISIHRVKVQVLRPDSLFLVVEEGICTEVHVSLPEIFFIQLLITTKTVVVFLNLVRTIVFLLKLLGRQLRVDSNDLVGVSEWDTVCSPVNRSFFDFSVTETL